MRSLLQDKYLGSAIDIAHDGMEFIVDKKPVGSEANVMKILVIDEGISPEKAESFVKQAREQKARQGLHVQEG